MKFIFKISFVTLTVFIGLILTNRSVFAIDNNCKNPSLYETQFNMAPTSGTAETEIQLEMKFRWNGFAYQGCRNTNLKFDVTWGISGANFVGEFDDMPIGIVGEEWVVRTIKTKVSALPGLSYNPTRTGTGKILFGMVVQDDDSWTGFGINLFTPIVKEFTLSIGNRICAYVAPNDRYSCISGSETIANCSSLSECNGKTCSKIDSSKCGDLAKTWACVANDGKYSCSRGNKQDLSDADGCVGKSALQIDPSRCGQSSGGSCGGSGQPACKPGEEQSFSFEIPNPLKGGASDFTSLVKIIAQWLFNLAIPIAVAMIVYSGILFLTSGGDTGKVTKARDVLKYAVIGLAIILIGSGFITLIQSILELGSSSVN